MQDKMNDDNLIISEVLSGNTNRYAALIQKYNQRLYRICRSYLREEAEIEDVMQDTYIKAFVNLKQYEGRSTFSTWITRILINESLLKRKRLTRRNATETTSLNNNHMNFSDNTNPERSSISKELGIIIEASIETLPENYRVVFIMREVEKMNVSETAGILSLSETNVKVRLNRAKEMLRNTIMSAYPLEGIYSYHLSKCSRMVSSVMSRIAKLSLVPVSIN